ncbi:MAG TPA: class II D-tagatose-bisphosphate aldolase, non-catalytic subunit [Anaerolineales bacterium]|nr:class II D-tagatose-bisphosphate aldolase, non-catalytic subunit [Anaerolineales bacterium]
MYLDEVLAAQKRGEAVGITSVCSAHPVVLRQSLEAFKHPLIEATCNQVNQFGGYTGMTPAAFVTFLRGLAREQGTDPESIILGGDHLGPHVWQDEPARNAMAKARDMIADYARAGFTKLHLDCSMRLADDPQGYLDPGVAARRAAEMASVAEQSCQDPLHYVIGTEVPHPGGVMGAQEGLHVSGVDDTRQTVDLHQKAFEELGLQAAWERVIAVVVQPGVEFGDDFVVPYVHEAARALSKFIEEQPVIYEAHSTDYQTPQALRELVRDHFAILKVGPALTFAYREGLFALAMIENECIPVDRRSNLIQVVESTMLDSPAYWKDYYKGAEGEQAFKCKFSLSDRVRYYWTFPRIQGAIETLLANLGEGPLPYTLCSQYLGEAGLTARQALQWKVNKVLMDYKRACTPTA